MEKLIEPCAVILHLYEGGLYPEEYEEVIGTSKSDWTEVEEWKKDEYRLQAKKVLELLKIYGNLNEE